MGTHRRDYRDAGVLVTPGRAHEQHSPQGKAENPRSAISVALQRHFYAKVRKIAP